MAIQNRRGVYTDFDESKMVAGEIAVVQSGDPSNTDGKAIYIAFQNGSVARLVLADEMGTLSDLETTVKTSVVDAINELAGRSDILYGSTITAGSTRDKIVTCEDFEAVDGTLIIVLFNQSNTATNARLNVNGTGACDIVRRGTTNTSWLAEAPALYLFRYTKSGSYGQYKLVGAIDVQASNDAPKMNGTTSAGTSDKYSRGDHVHPSDTTKVDKIVGKGLSTEDYTTAEKTKLSGIEEQATKTVIDATLANAGQAADAKKVGDELTNLKDDISQSIKTNVPTWSIGALQSAGGSNYMEQYNSKRIRTNEFLKVDGNYKISCASDAQYSIRFYDDSMLTISGTRWLSSQSDIESLGTGVYFRVQARYANDTEITNVSDLSNKITLTGNVIVEDALAKVNNNIVYGVSFEQNFDVSDFIKGYITNGSLYVGGANSYATNVPIYAFPFDIKLTPSSGHKIVVWKQKIDGTWENSGWVTSSYTLNKDTRFRLTISLEPEDRSVPMVISDLVSAISVYSVLVDSVSKNTNKINEIISLQSANNLKSDLYDLQDGRMFRIKGINHRGWNSVAPENSLPAFKLSAQHGFNFVETDVQFTKDNVPVLIHNRLINTYARNADGTEISNNQYVDQNTYDQLLQYDWGIYKNAEYAGLKIARFDEFIPLCKKLGLHPYIEIKVVSVTFTQEQIESLVNIVSEYDMLDSVTWVSFSDIYLSYVKAVNPTARLGYLIGTVDSTAINTATSLKTISNNVFIDTAHYTNEQIQLCINAELPMEVYTIDTQATIEDLPTYISGVTSNNLIAGRVIYSANIN